MRKRERLAQQAERAAVPERPFHGSGPRYLVQPTVTAACAPSLLGIAAALRDETRPIDDAGLEALGRFVSDGASAFFGHNATVALWEAIRLERIVGVEAPAPHVEEFAVAV